MFTPTVFMLMLSRHLPTVCGGIGVSALSVWVGAGDIPVIMDGTVLIGDPDGAGAPAGVGAGLLVGIITDGMILGTDRGIGMVAVIGLIIMFIIIIEDLFRTGHILQVVDLHLIITIVQEQVRLCVAVHRPVHVRIITVQPFVVVLQQDV